MIQLQPPFLYCRTTLPIFDILALCLALIAMINHGVMKPRLLSFHVVCLLKRHCTLGLHYTQ